MQQPTAVRGSFIAEEVPSQQCIKDIKSFILARNKEQSDQFSNAAARAARQHYRATHSTEPLALKCMDGRLNISVMMKMPVGIIQPFRNVGANFDLGWPLLGELLNEWATYSIGQGRNCIIFATYHFSKGDTHRGCKGFGYDTDKARASAAKLVRQIGAVFGKPYTVVHPVLMGLETDEGSLVLHGENGEVFSIADHLELNAQELNVRLAELYPQMRPSVRADFCEWLQGNQEYVKETIAQNRPPIDLDHREQVIAVGRGFDWLHQPNLALIIGPYSPEWPKAVATAGGIVLDNLKRGQLDPDSGLLLLVSALARGEQQSYTWNLAVEKARFMAHLALETLAETTPALVQNPNFSVLTGVVDAQTRLMHILD